MTKNNYERGSDSNVYGKNVFNISVRQQTAWKKVRNTANIKLAIGPFKLFEIDSGSVCYEKKVKNNTHDQFHRKKIEWSHRSRPKENQPPQ